MHKILVIDDDPAGTELLLTLLELEGYQGSRLENWTDPLVDLEAQCADLVIMDVHLVAEDGLALLRQVRAHSDPRVARLPILMISAEALEAECMSAGADGFIEKPFDLNLLFEAIRSIVEGSLLDD